MLVLLNLKNVIAVFFIFFIASCYIKIELDIRLRFPSFPKLKFSDFLKFILIANPFVPVVGFYNFKKKKNIINILTIVNILCLMFFIFCASR